MHVRQSLETIAFDRTGFGPRRPDWQAVGGVEDWRVVAHNGARIWGGAERATALLLAGLAAVAAWQGTLNRVTGTHLRLDGHFGPETVAATRNFQRDATGRFREGKVKAPSEGAVADKLIGMGYQPLQIKRAGTGLC